MTFLAADGHSALDHAEALARFEAGRCRIAEAAALWAASHLMAVVLEHRVDRAAAAEVELLLVIHQNARAAAALWARRWADHAAGPAGGGQEGAT